MFFKENAFKKKIDFAARFQKKRGKTGEECLKKPLNNMVTGSRRKRKWIFRSIENNDLFQGLDVYAIWAMVENMWSLDIPKGTQVITQGDVGGNFFLVQKGKLNVYINSFDGKQMKKCDKIKKNAVFGELSVLYNTPRSATVITSTKCKLWTLDRFIYQRILRNITTYQLKSYEKFLMKVPLFSSLSVRERSKIAEAIVEEEFLPGDIVMKQGQNTEKEYGFASMYIIVSGCFKVEKFVDGRKFEMEILKSLNYFGERALLKNEPRSATITCLTKAHVIKLDRQAVMLLLGPLENIFEAKFMTYNQRDSFHSIKTQESKFDNSYNHSLQGRISADTRRSSSYCVDEHVLCISKKMSKPKLTDLVVLGTLGKGSFGRVRLVQNQVTNKTYALKSVSRDKINTKKRRLRLLNEKRILQKLQHPFIINLEETFKDDKFFYYLLEPALGGELFTTLRSYDSFENGTVKFYMASLVLILEYIHSNNIVYRDLKLENVVLDIHGYCKLTDFGLSNYLKPNGRLDTICGTPAYLSPEMIARKAYGPSVDWWALGIFMFELVAGYNPFREKGQNLLSLYKRISSGEFTVPPFVSQDVQEMLINFLKVEPSERLGVIGNGAETVKEQSWFHGFDFNALEERRMRPPVIPYIRNNRDTHNFALFVDPEIGKTFGQEIRNGENYRKNSHVTWDASF